MKTRPTARSLARFAYFSACPEARRMTPVPLAKDGHTAAECFHVRETYGKWLPCREPELLARALNGKERHGMTITALAEDYVGRVLFACEIRDGYPEWVQKDILGRAAQIARQALGFVPGFVRTGTDFTT